MLIKKNERFIKLFKDYILRFGSSSTSSYGGYYGYDCYGASRGSNYQSSYKPLGHKIYFYEWSNLSNRSKEFDSIESFKTFCKDSKISICEHHISMMEHKYYVYCTCIPNSTALMMRGTYHELSEALAHYQHNSNYNYSY